MWSTWCFGKLFLVLVVWSLLINEGIFGGLLPGQRQQLCPEGWTYFEDNFSGGLCVYPVKEPKTWKEANDFCTKQYSHLIKLDLIHQYVFYGNNEQITGLGKFLFDEGFQDFWTGMHVKDGRLMWAAYGPEYVKRRSYETGPWEWADGQPSTDQGKCGILNLGSREEKRANEGTEEGITVTVFDNKYTAAFSPCEKQRQFVCQSPAVRVRVQYSSKCEPDWVGNIHLPDCYRVFRAESEFSAYDKAEKECKNIGGELAPVTSALDRGIAVAVINNFEINPELRGVWVYNRPAERASEECFALRPGFGEVPQTEPVVLSCDMPLPFICRKPYKYQVPDKLEILSAYTDQTELLDYQPFSPIPVSCRLSRPPVDSEILFIETPDGIINSTNGWRETNGFYVQTSGPDETPYYFNVTIPDSQVPSKRKRRALNNAKHADIDAAIERAIQQRKKRQATEYEIVRTTGYYSCGFISIFPPYYKDTENILVRYSESDLFIYIAKVVARDGFISPEGNIKPQDIIMFNLLKDTSYVDILFEYLGSLTNNLAVESLWSGDVQTYRAVIEEINGRTFQFRVFLGLPRRWSNVEQDALVQIETFWQNGIAGSNSFQSVEFKSTVACSAWKYYEEGGSRYATFPAIKIGSTARSSEECYLGTSPVAYAECQGNYEEGARWGEVKFTDGCLTDRLNICPDGWRSFNYNNEISCVLPVKKVYNWTDANRNCKRNEGHLLKLDDINLYFSNVDSEKGTKSLGEYLFDTDVQDFWSGMNVQEDRLFWTTYIPEHVERAKYDERPWNWGPGQPSTEEGNCGMVRLGSTERQVVNETTQDEYTINVFNNQYTVSLTNCKDLKQSVCMRTAIPDQVYNTIRCEDGWVSNFFLPECYRVFNSDEDMSTYEVAEKKCRSMGGELASVLSEFDKTIATRVNDFYFTFDYSDSPSEANDGIWIQNKPEDMIINGICNAFETGFSDGRIFDIKNLPCDTFLAFMCRKPALPHESISFEATTPYRSQRKLKKYPPFHPLPLSLSLSRPPLASEIIYIHTPNGIIDSTYNWKETRGFTVSVSDQADRPYMINITIPNLTVEARDEFRRRRGVNSDVALTSKESLDHKGSKSRTRRVAEFGFPILRQTPNENEIARTLGYYSFGLRSIYPPSYTVSQPDLVRYSESDLYIYVAKVALNETFMSSQQFTMEDLTSFSLLRDDSYLSLLYDFTSFMNDLNIEEDWIESVQTYKAGFDRASGRNIYFRVFVGIYNSRDLPAKFEQIVMKALEKYWRSEINKDIFLSVNFKSTVACPLTTKTDKDSGLMATFPVTRIGETAYSWERCFKASGALAIAKCEGGYDKGARWGPITFKDCIDIPDITESESTPSLKQLSELDVTEDNFMEILENTTYLTLPAFNLTEADVIYVADILYNYQLFGVITDETLNYVIDIVDHVLDTASGIIMKAQTLDNSANRIIEAIDDIVHLFDLNRSATKRLVRKFLAAEVWQQNGGEDSLTIGVSLENNRNDSINRGSISSITDSKGITVGETDAAIYLPVGIVKGKLSRLSFLIYGKPDLFTPVGGRYKTNSKVAAARLNIDGEALTDLGAEVVTAVFLPFESDDDLTCGFWDYSANEKGGGWNTEGCTLMKENDRIVCQCNHLTNFAVLIDLGAHEISDIHKQILSIITIVGLSISIVGLSLTLLGFLMFKHLRNGRGQQVLVMLSLSMLCSAIIFLAGMDKTSSRIGCIVVAALLHYFILVSFMWMLVEGVLQYLRFVKVLGTYIPNFLIKSAIPAWGIPLIPVIVILAVDYDLYYGGKGYCWLSFKPMLYGFIIPVAAIILANSIVFTMVLCNLFRRRNKHMQINQSERKMAFLHFQAALSIFVILGLTWVFGFLAIDDARIVFHYLFAILNAFQGFFIFLLFTAREKLIRQAWRKFCCGRKYKEKTSTHSGSDTKTGRKTSHDITGSTGSGTKFSNISNEHKNGHGSNDNLLFRNPQFENQ